MAGCAKPAAERAAQPAAAAHLRVAAYPMLVFAPLYLARDRGYFAAEGLDVELVRLPFGAPQILALARDQVDVIVERPSVALLEAVAAGERIAAVADSSHVAAQDCVRGGILARPELARDPSPAALLGRRVEMDRAGIENFMLDRVLAPIGKSSADVDAVDLDDPAIGEAFANGAIDFAFASEPWSSEITRSGRAVVWRSYEEIAPGFQLGFVLYGPRLLDREPALGNRFMAAYLRAVAAIAGGLGAEDRVQLGREFGIEPAKLAQLCPTPVRLDGAISRQGIDEFQRWAVARGFLERPTPLDRFVDPRFAAAVAGAAPADAGPR